jgi:periplasmic protein TonB
MELPANLSAHCVRERVAASCLAATVSCLAILAGCTSAPLPVDHAPAPQANVPPPAPPAASGPTQSLALTVDGYKRDVAKHIYQVNAQELFEGPPPPILQSVIVLSIVVDANGNPKAVTVFRTNGYRNHEEAAVRSVMRAAPLPMPNRLFMKAGQVQYTETWLFRDDGRYQIRSLAQVQESGG